MSIKHNCHQSAEDRHRYVNSDREIEIAVGQLIEHLIDSVLIADSIIDVCDMDISCVESEPLTNQQLICYSLSPNNKLNSMVNEYLNDPIQPVPYIHDQCSPQSQTNELSPKKGSTNGSSYLKLSRVSPNSVISDNFDYNYSVWNNNKTEPQTKSAFSRLSLFRQFDPLAEGQQTESNSQEYKDPVVIKTENKSFNESSNLSKAFESLDIKDSPKSEYKYSNSIYVKSAKPDVLDFAVHERDFNSQQKKELEEKLKEKDAINNDLKEELEKSKEENKRITKAFDSLNFCNQELLETATEVLAQKESEIHDWKAKCDSLKSEKIRATDDVNSIERNFSDLHKRYDKLRNEFSISKDSENKCKTKLSSIENRNQELEEMNSELKTQLKETENQSFMKQNKNGENELIAMRAQLKMCEMKINSLQNQLEQKSEENLQLSSMVDELIVKVRK